MSEEQKIETMEDVEKKPEEVPAEPEEKKEPEAGAAPSGEAEEAPKGEGETNTEEKKEKKIGGVARRFTFNKRWGKHRDDQHIPKEPEEPKDPKEDVIGWITQQIPQAVHKANYLVLNWIQSTAIEDEKDRKNIPGKDQSTTRNQFLSFLRDGDLLVKFANSLQNGAIEPTVAEENADAEAQQGAKKKNIDSFAAWANTVTGVEGGMTSEDLLEKGKAGYPAVFQTLWNIGLKAKEKLDKEGLDVENVIKVASQVVKSNLLTTILGFFRRNRPAAIENAEEVKNEEGDKANTEEKAADQTADEQKNEQMSPPAVAAN